MASSTALLVARGTFSISTKTAHIYANVTSAVGVCYRRYMICHGLAGIHSVCGELSISTACFVA
jgi:hypothetical protein